MTQNKPLNEITINDVIAEGDDKVNFDVVIGNPPFQESISTGKDNEALGKQLFPTFIEISYELTSQYCSLISPSRWFTGDAQDKSFPKLRDFLRKNHNVQKIYVYPNTDDVFKGVTIKGGVNFFLVNKSYCGDVEFHTVKKENETIENRALFEDGFDIVFRCSIDSSIVKKVVNNSSDSLCSITTGRNAFGIIGKLEDLNKRTSSSQSSDSVLVHCKNGEKRYIAKKAVDKGVEIMDHYKVFISKSAGDPKTDNLVIGKPLFGDKGSVCTDTFFPIGCFEKKEEAENLCSYLKTRFVRFLVNVLKSSQNVTQIVYKFVPMQDFTNKSDIDWTKSVSEIDAQLYKKYDLADEEIAFIESSIKPVE